MSRPPSPEAAKLDWSALIETALTVPGSTGDTYNRLHEYSFLNRINLMMQGCPLEPIATYKRWQSLGRQVLKGSHAYEIIRPIIIPKKDEAGEKTGETFRRFKSVRAIFPVSMTEGEPLPEVELPEWSLDTALQALDIRRVPFVSFSSNTQGFSYERTFAINPVAKYPMKTTMHELSHIVSGHTTKNELAEYEQHRGVKEFEAEGSAHLVMNELGALTDEQAEVSRGYVQGWLKNERPHEASIRRIFTTTETILKAGRVALAGVEIESVA
jgi:antirestriction protein ArdC